MKKIKKILCLFLATVACLFITACTPSSLGKAKDKMKKEGYTVTTYEVEADGVVGGIMAVDSEFDMLYAVLFESRADAKAFAENSASGVQDGKWVYWGTEDAIEDFTEGF